MKLRTAFRVGPPSGTEAEMHKTRRCRRPEITGATSIRVKNREGGVLSITPDSTVIDF